MKSCWLPRTAWLFDSWEADARPMGRDTKGVKGVNLGKDDEVVGFAVADPEGQLLTVCLNGYGKRIRLGPVKRASPL